MSRFRRIEDGKEEGKKRTEKQEKQIKERKEQGMQTGHGSGKVF